MGFFSRLRRCSDEPRLLDAAERADVSSVRNLLDAGANPDVRDVYRYTPLMRAVSRVTEPAERGTVIDLLLASGADGNAVEQASQTALMHAAHSDNSDAVHRLLAAGANVQSRAASDRDALHIAFDHGNLEIGRALAKAELSIQGSARRLVCAALLGDALLVERSLTDGESADVADGNGLTPLHAAALAGDAALIDVLASAGASLDAQDSEGVTPLIQAARSGRRDVVAKLIERGANSSMRMRTMYGDDALSAAARDGHEDVVRALLAGGAAIDAIHTNGNGSALTAAASRGQERIVVLLLEQGASAREVGALCAAASSGSAAIVKLLLSAGADPNERLEIPEPHNSSISPLVNAVVGATPAIVALLVEAGADVNARDARGDTPLILLAEITGKPSEQVEVARVLLAARAEVNAVGEHHRTAFYMARQNGNTILADALIEAGADPTLVPNW